MDGEADGVRQVGILEEGKQGRKNKLKGRRGRTARNAEEEK